MRRNKYPQDLRKIIEFHGHLCPGLVMGYRVAKAALRRLKITRARDEELVVIAENKSCSVDAVQFLTSCTFGKGNLFFRNYGKQVFTFVRRPQGDGVRVVVYPERFKDKPSSREEFIEILLKTPEKKLLKIEKVTVKLPKEAKIYPTLICANCNEGVMKPAAIVLNKKVYCRPCYNKLF